jgi:DNA polymerase
MHQPAQPFAHSSGPKTAKVALVGEAWGREEEMVGLPFVGQAGQELTRELSEAGIDRARCFLTNVLALRPPSNQLDAICCRKADAGAYYPLKPLSLGKYLHPQYLPELTRLKQELDHVQPNLVIALGGTATWALLNHPQIGSIRGTVAQSTLVPALKVLGTYHPAAVLRNIAYRPICIADYKKAVRQSQFPEIRRPERLILVNPTLEEADAYAGHLLRAPLLSIDIETFRGQIKMVGFAGSLSCAMVIPFVDLARGGSYWPTPAQELYAWGIVRRLLESPVPKLFQNGLYDLQYFIRMGFRPRACTHDTMLMSHALYPELQKGLGFLGSVWTDEPAWKLMRSSKSTETKRDE